ncbi:hypothetical protein [Luteitalea sp.]|uniref:hypothetical protein n=1 Tax=Luteitalea sp. TaxID=2004800 RepID=UPI0037C83E5C
MAVRAPWATLYADMADVETQKAGTDTLTKVLLGLIAAGLWALVGLELLTARKIDAIAAEVAAIGADTEAIHEDIDPSGGEDEADDHATSWRR